MIEQKKHYRIPAILREVQLELEANLMASVVDKTKIQSSGQEVQTYDYGAPAEENVFKHDWTD